MIFAVCAYFAFALVGEQELNHKDGELPADQFVLVFHILPKPRQVPAHGLPHLSLPQVHLLQRLDGCRPCPRRPLGGRRQGGLQGGFEGKLFEFIQNIFSQIKELVQRHLWSIGRSLRQEEKDLLWSVIKAKKDEAS